MSQSLEQRLADLEIRYTLQEDALEQLGRELRVQQQTVDRLARQMEALGRRLMELEPSPLAPDSEENPPPHY